MMVMVVVGILGTFALPAYSDYQRQAQLPEAFNGLAEFRLRMEHYFQDNNRFGNSAGNACADDPSAAAWNDFAPRGAHSFNYRCTVQADQAGYVIVASGKAGSAVAGYTFTIDHLARHGTLQFRGQAVNESCWLTSQASC
ncbi:type IV pilin protein [Variovorax dokdonensis]|uniref:Type IV pilin protein n=2 Tax=Variovorax dokdonensis TaxID=344883 RepID=A0ABT7N9T4_9BURK|nr:type IV pilin protein [Variovorax dokdonensis]MDM0044635.1 type IV pilin protein [Variovorax dokdonensis]